MNATKGNEFATYTPGVPSDDGAMGVNGRPFAAASFCIWMSNAGRPRGSGGIVPVSSGQLPADAVPNVRLSD
jgi:hypothetical protein